MWTPQPPLSIVTAAQRPRAPRELRLGPAHQDTWVPGLLWEGHAEPGPGRACPGRGPQGALMKVDLCAKGGGVRAAFLPSLGKPRQEGSPGATCAEDKSQRTSTCRLEKQRAAGGCPVQTPKPRFFPHPCLPCTMF